MADRHGTNELHESKEIQQKTRKHGGSDGLTRKTSVDDDSRTFQLWRA